MNKQLVRWRAFNETNFVGVESLIPLAEELDIHCRGTLLSQIVSMEPKTPISYQDAMSLTHETLKKCWKEKKISSEFGHYYWYFDHFCEWLSILGYHIELTGDEFELYFTSDQTI